MSADFIDLAISVRLADVERDASGRPQWVEGSDEELVRVGGRWDRKKKRWDTTKPAKRCLVLRFHRGQEESIRWLVDWLRRFAKNDWKGTKRNWSAILIGGRRSGKTHVCCAMLVIFAVLNPRARIWAISPTLETGDELDQNFRAMLPRSWYVRRQAKTGRSTTYTLTNKSRILLKSAVKPTRLKAGRVDLALLNEAQDLSVKAYEKLRAAIADRGGLVLLAANPPETPAGRWVETNYVKAKKGEIDSVAFQLDPRRNPWINFAALEAMGGEIDEKTFQRDVLGLFPPIGDVVFHSWDDFESWKDPTADLVDITAMMTRQLLGRAAGDIVGMDFQKMPAMVGAVLRFYRDPKDPEGTPLLWVVDEAFAEDSDEDGLLDILEAIPRYEIGDGPPDKRVRERGPLRTYRGWTVPEDSPSSPRHAVVVMDASGFFQDGAHTKGRTSELYLKKRDWRFLFRPQPPRLEDGTPVLDNPAIVERMKLGNALLKANSGRRRLFVARHCKRIAEALREYANDKHGFPDRHSIHAHPVDAVTYPAFRFFGRPKAKSNAKKQYRSVGQRFDRREMFAGVY